MKKDFTNVKDFLDYLSAENQRRCPLKIARLEAGFVFFEASAG